MAATRATLDAIARLPVRIVIPGHGQSFTDVGAALERSLQRLAAFERDELRMVCHVLKVMFVFSLMDRRRLAVDELDNYLESVPLYADFNRQYLRLDRAALAELSVGDQERSGAVRRPDGFLIAACKRKRKRAHRMRPYAKCVRTWLGTAGERTHEGPILGLHEDYYPLAGAILL